jgi:hypothetical protein
MSSPPFGETEAFVSQIVQYLMLNGSGPAVAVLAAASRVWMEEGDTDFGQTAWGLGIGLPGPLYVRWTDDERSKVADVIAGAANRVRQRGADHVSHAWIDVDIAPRTDWRADAMTWLFGEGVNNQGRVRSDNMPTRQEDGLLFRSLPEIHIYKALKTAGVTFAPLPVYLHGGRGAGNYQRIEPDFVVFQEGRVMLVEVDGDTFHHETPAEADRRTKMFEDEGAFVRHVKATECDSPDKAATTVRELLASFERWRRAR